MSKKEKQKEKVVNHEKQKKMKILKILAGVILILFSIDGLLNVDPVGGFFTYIFIYLFGYMFFFVYLIAILVAIYLMFAKNGFFKKNMAIVLSITIFSVLALLMFTSFSKNPLLYTDNTNENYFLNIINGSMEQLGKVEGNLKVNYTNKIGITGGGFIGYFLVSLMTINGNFGLAVTVSVIFGLVALAILIVPMTLAIVKKKKNKNKNDELQDQTLNQQTQNPNVPFDPNQQQMMQDQMQNLNYQNTNQYPNYNQNQFYNNQYQQPFYNQNQYNNQQYPNQNMYTNQQSYGYGYNQQPYLNTNHVENTPIVVNEQPNVNQVEQNLQNKNAKKDIIETNAEDNHIVNIRENNCEDEITDIEVIKVDETPVNKKAKQDTNTRFSSNIKDYPTFPIKLQRENVEAETIKVEENNTPSTTEQPTKQKGFFAKLFNFKKQNKDEEDIDIKEDENVDKYIENLSHSNNSNVNDQLFGREVKIDYKQNKISNKDEMSSNNSNKTINRNDIKPENVNPYGSEIPLTKRGFDNLKQKEINKPIKKVEPTYEQHKEEINFYPLPPISLLEDHIEYGKYEINNKSCYAKQEKINQFFNDYKIDARVESYTIGPSVTRFNIRTSPGVKISTMANRVEELQMYLRGDKSVRVETVVEGRDTSGIEVGNAEPMTVPFKSVYNKLSQINDTMTIALGTNIDGEIVTCKLDDLPHLLVAGTTGSGKSVFIHSIIMSLIMRNYPHQLRLILIDPKKVEFTKYQNIPHLYCRIVDDIVQATAILGELVSEMERRYTLLSTNACVNLKEYRKKREENPNLLDLPNIVCIIDEFADLMSQDSDDVELSVQRLAQKARACGIYLIIATQRPSVKVITGDIKANIPARVALSVSSQIDSRTILDEIGAETLVGKGDLLARIPGHKSLIRVQSPYVSNDEITRITTYLTKFGGLPRFDQRFNRIQILEANEETEEDDDFYEE